MSYAGFALHSVLRLSAWGAQCSVPHPTHTDTLLIHSYKEEEQWGGCQQAMGWLSSPCSASNPIPTRFPHAHFSSPLCASPSLMVVPWCLTSLELYIELCEYLGQWLRIIRRQRSASNTSSPGTALLVITWWREGSFPLHDPQKLSPPVFNHSRATITPWCYSGGCRE